MIASATIFAFSLIGLAISLSMPRPKRHSDE